MSDLICRKTMQRCQTAGMCMPHGGCRVSVLVDSEVHYSNSTTTSPADTIDKAQIKALAERVKTDRRLCRDDFHVALAAGVLALLAEIEKLQAQVRLAGVAGEMAVHEAVGRAATDFGVVVVERDQLKAENEALRKSISGKVVCDLELFEDLRDSAAAEADGHRQSMGSYRPQRQEVLDHTVSRCDLLIAAAKEASNG